MDQAPLGGSAEHEHGLEPALLALLAACRNRGLWQLGRAVLRGAPDHGLPASLAAANEVIAACAAAGAAAEVRATTFLQLLLRPSPLLLLVQRPAAAGRRFAPLLLSLRLR